MLQITPKLMACAGIVLAAVPVSAFAPARERGAAVACSSLLLTAWLLHLASWTSWSIEAGLARLGIGVAAIDAWAVVNFCCGGLVLALASRNGRIGVFTWWGPLLFGCLFAACANDVVYWLTDRWAPFSTTSDVIFLAENALFFAVGGPRCADHLLDVSRRLRRHVLGAPAAVSFAPVTHG